MFSKFFNKKPSTTNKEVSCEVTGQLASLDDTISLVRINGIILSKNFKDAEIDIASKLIYSADKDPIRFYKEILVPDNLKPVFGRLFAIVEDEDEIEKSTSIISSEGINSYTGKSIFPLGQYISEVEILQIPDSMFFSIIVKDEGLLSKSCENWGVQYKGVNRKYMSKKILDTRKDKQQFGYPGIMIPGYDVGITDVSEKHPQGHGYLFKTNKSYTPVDLCSNESAVDFCLKNNVLVYYNDFLNKGKLRLLSKYTPSINRNLQNPYDFRSSNI